MRDELLNCYERELTYLRGMAAEFAEKYPKIAQRLALEKDKCEDPHVERLIESFAFLAARIKLKIEDEFPELTDSLLQVIYPHFLSPIPSMSMVQFVLDPEQGKITSGYTIERNTTLFSKPSGDTVCRFRTCYPVNLWPVAVDSAQKDVRGLPDGEGKPWQGALILKLTTPEDVPLSSLEMDSLRFFLSGENELIDHLYEALFADCGRVELRDPAQGTTIRLKDDCIGEVGFGKEEGMLPYSHRSFLGYRLLQEYLALPQKFHFFDLRGLKQEGTENFNHEMEVVFFLNHPLLFKVTADNFQLGCTPVVNLFEQSAEPIRMDHAKTEYRVIPDIRRQLTTEVYSVDSVSSVSPRTGSSQEFQPFYSFKHSLQKEQSQAFWHATRRPSERKDDAGTEVYLTLVDLAFTPAIPATEALTVQVTCTNRDLPGMLSFGDPDGDFQMEKPAPIKRICCLISPTKSQRAPMRHASRWRLISHLSLNYLSLVENDGKPEALQEILKLYDFSGSKAINQQIEGIIGVTSRQVIRRIRTGDGSGFARGIEVRLCFDESRYVGSGVFLFGSVLEKFLGLYVSVNSFSEMVAETKQRGILKRWRPRAGYQILL
jgi:type VI secretion system protein ImpG